MKTINAQIISVTLQSNPTFPDEEFKPYTCQAWQFIGQDGEIVGFLVPYSTTPDALYEDLESATSDNILEVNVTGNEEFTRSQIKKIIGQHVKDGWEVPQFAWDLIDKH
jgi:hypothetical protein